MTTPTPPNPADWSSAQFTVSQKQIFALYPGFPGFPSDPSLKDTIKFFLNQSLIRDGFVGGWVDWVYPSTGDTTDPDTLTIKVTSPTQDVSGFAAQAQKLFTVGTVALQEYNSVFPSGDKPGWSFCLPWGAPLVNYQTIQLLHFPPDYSKTFFDYLYAKTVSRWDTLLRNNGLSADQARLQERIIDIVPIAAPSNAGSALEPYDDKFGTYTSAMLNLFLLPPWLSADSLLTVPIMALGSPVRSWLWDTYKDQIQKQDPSKQKLSVLDLVVLEVIPGRKTWVLIANHPSAYTYDTDKPIGPDSIATMREDLVCAGWNAAMAVNPAVDPQAALDAAKALWADDAKVTAICAMHNTMFGRYTPGDHPFPSAAANL